MKISEAEQQRLRTIDSRLVQLAKNVNVLGSVSWPAEAQETFLRGAQSGQPRLPVIEYQRRDLGPTRRDLDQLAASLDTANPIEAYLHSTARSYAVACELLESVGTTRAGEVAIRLFGKPQDSLSGGRVTNLDAARHFLDVSQQYYQQNLLEADDYCLPATVMRDEMATRLKAVIDGHTITIAIDETLVSKAAAGATRIRLRAGTCFSEYDLEQLLQHEVFVHSLTAINGREQPLINALSLGAPRTTQAQEGLATFSELVTGAMDITRMERIALRVEAIDRALSGADFIEVFRYFMSVGQPEIESFNSTMRVFRGVPTNGGSAFTKDTVYLHGLMEVHTFFRWAFSHGKLEVARHFFAGRMTIGDAIRLAPLFADGVLAPPRYLPPWMTRTNGLAGYLAFSVFANQIRIDELDEGHEFDSIEEVGI